MESIGMLQAVPLNPYLDDELSKRFNVLKFWNIPEKSDQEFLATNARSIRAVVGNAAAAADRRMIDALPMLEIVACYSAGVDKVDLERCRERGIRVTNAGDLVTDDAADVALALMLAVLRRLPQCDRHVRSRRWKTDGEFQLTTKLSGKRVGIIGLGRIGSAIARRAQAFGCPISYHSRSIKPSSTYTYYPSVVDLASNSDILVVSCALTAETHHIVGRRVTDALGPAGVLINVGRGPHVDEAELVSALIDGRLGAAGLDVFEHEPDVGEELSGMENVVVLPHVGSATVETRKAMADAVLGNLEAHFLGKPLLTPVV